MVSFIILETKNLFGQNALRYKNIRKKYYIFECY